MRDKERINKIIKAENKIIEKRNKKRINKTLKQIKITWEKNDQLRLCQLLSNCFDFNDLYYVEDEALFKHLKQYDEE